MILQPHHYEFAETLANLPHFYKQIASNSCDTLHIIQKNPNWLPEIVNDNNLQEYLLGGEASQCVEFIDGYNNELGEYDNELEQNDYHNLPNSWELGDKWVGSI